VVFDSFEDPIANASVTLSLGNNTIGAVLSGTTTRVTDATGTATFSDLSVNKAGGPFTLIASVDGVTVSSNQFTVGFSPHFGQATDLLGDSRGAAVTPDLVWASVMTTTDGNVKLMVRYAAGTFDPKIDEA